MPAAPARADLMGATEQLLARLSPHMRDLLRELLLHKSLFASESFVSLAMKHDAEEGRTFRRIFDETVAEGVATSKRLEEWDRTRSDEERVERVAADVRRNLIEALIVLKELSTEAFLAAAMAAPTKELRDELIRLADVDRAHADDLRAVIGVSTIAERLTKEEANPDAGPCGAHGGRYVEGSLGHSIERTIQKLRANHCEPARLILSPTSARHLRDEGRMDQNMAFGLPIDLDLGWMGETFAVLTRDRATMAEIVTALATDAARE